MTYSFHPEARQELEQAVDYYEGCAGGLGYEFSLEVHSAIQRIADFPEAWEQMRPGVRRCLLKRFPYAVLYSADREHDRHPGGHASAPAFRVLAGSVAVAIELTSGRWRTLPGRSVSPPHALTLLRATRTYVARSRFHAQGDIPCG